MKFVRINPISRSIVYLKPLSETGAELSIATGFLYQNDQDIFLVTNRHVVTGRNLQDNRVLSKTGALPHTIKSFIASIEKSTEGGGKSICRWIEYDIGLYEKSGKPLWYEHENNAVDVVTIKLEMKDEVEESLNPLNANKLHNFPIEISDDVFIIGYPVGITGGKKLPIWKRGSIASEPDMNIDDMSKIIIDTSTREGMSGSPVIARTDNMLVGKDGTIPEDEFFGAHYRFVGIYSGRLNSRDEEDDFTTHLGIVWKKEYLDQIFTKMALTVPKVEP